MFDIVTRCQYRSPSLTLKQNKLESLSLEDFRACLIVDSKIKSTPLERVEKSVEKNKHYLILPWRRKSLLKFLTKMPDYIKSNNIF